MHLGSQSRCLIDCCFPTDKSTAVPLLAGLNTKQRSICISAGAMVRRQQALGQWTGDLVIATR